MRKALDSVASVCLDEILIYSDLVEDDKEHVQWVIQWLLDAGEDWKHKNWEFHNSNGTYFGLNLSCKGISMN